MKRLRADSSLHQRVNKITKERCLGKVDILEYKKEYKHYFKSLNYAWITEYFKMEDMDEQLLANPEEIITQGGAVLFARINNQIVGTCAMIRIDEHTYELAKMAVDKDYQRRHVGEKLGLAVIEKSSRLGARKLILESNKKLIPALNLYRKLGFIPICSDHKKSMYQRVNISMQMNLVS